MKKEEQAPGTERVTIAVTLDFAGFGAGTCTVGITSLQDESLSEDAKRLQVAMMVASTTPVARSARISAGCAGSLRVRA